MEHDRLAEVSVKLGPLPSFENILFSESSKINHRKVKPPANRLRCVCVSNLVGQFDVGQNEIRLRSLDRCDGFGF